MHIEQNFTPLVDFLVRINRIAGALQISRCESARTTKGHLTKALQEERGFFDSGKCAVKLVAFRHLTYLYCIAEDSGAEQSSDPDTSSGEEYESQSENEVEPHHTDECSSVGVHGEVGILHRSIVIFLCLWQSIFTISDTAMAILLSFFCGCNICLSWELF